MTLELSVVNNPDRFTLMPRKTCWLNEFDTCPNAKGRMDLFLHQLHKTLLFFHLIKKDILGNLNVHFKNIHIPFPLNHNLIMGFASFDGKEDLLDL